MRTYREQKARADVPFLPAAKVSGVVSARSRSGDSLIAPCIRGGEPFSAVERYLRPPDGCRTRGEVLVGETEFARTMSVSRAEFTRKASACRARAEEVRAVADDMHNLGARLAMLQLAETYESVARHLEANHIGTDSAESPAG